MNRLRTSPPVELLIFGISIVVHAVVGWQYRVDPFLTQPISDALSYHQWGQRIAESGWSAEPVFHQAPLFPVLLGALYALLPPPSILVGALVLQALLMSAAIALLVPLGRDLFGSRGAGVAAAVVALLHAPFLFHALKLVPVSLALFTQILMLRGLTAARCGGGNWRALFAGVALGLAALARPEMLLFVPVALVALYRPGAGRTDRRAPAWALVAFALTLAPVASHNFGRGDLVLIASSAGENLFIGNQRGADGGHTPLHPKAGDLFSQRELARQIAEEARGEPLRPSQVSDYWRWRAIEELRADPIGGLQRVGRKLARLFDPGDPTDMYSLSLERRHYLGTLHLSPLSPWGLLLLAAIGLRVAGRRRLVDAWPLCGLLAVHLTVLAAFFVSTRLRLPFYFFLTPWAGLALHAGWTRVRDGRRRLAIAIVGGLLLGLSVHGAFASRATARERLRLASVLSIQGRLDESLDVLAPCLVGPGQDSECLDQAGYVQFKAGRWSEARQRYLQALEAGLPAWRSPQVRTRLAWTHERLGEWELARRQHDLAVREPESSAGSYLERGQFLLRRGQRAAGISDLRRAAELAPGWPEPRRALREAGAAPAP